MLGNFLNVSIWKPKFYGLTFGSLSNLYFNNLFENRDYHSHKKQKDSLEARVKLLIFSLELKISGVVKQRYIKTAKIDNFCEELPTQNDFETVLGTFCCYDHNDLLRQFRRSLQMKRSIVNAPHLLYFAE